jgi:hypothetical protein
MFRRIFVAATTLLAATAVMISLPVPTHATVPADSGCGSGPQEPNLQQIQGWVKQYYPGFLVRTTSSGKVAVGFVVDAQCNIRRHGAAFLPDTGWSEDLIMTVFPDIHRTHERAGIADGMPPQMLKNNKRDQHLVATYIMMP